MAEHGIRTETDDMHI